MKELATHGIFPTPIYFSELERDFTKKELKFFEKNKSTTYANEGNTTSDDNYILNNSELEELKSEVMVAVQKYIDNVLSFKPTVTPYITQSWLNFTEVGQYHHKGQFYTGHNSPKHLQGYVRPDQMSSGSLIEDTPPKAAHQSCSCHTKNLHNGQIDRYGNY